jgi:hypothetical protein
MVKRLFGKKTKQSSHHDESESGMGTGTIKPQQIVLTHQFKKVIAQGLAETSSVEFYECQRFNVWERHANASAIIEMSRAR